jgi:hypothetical protein
MRDITNPPGIVRPAPGEDLATLARHVEAEAEATRAADETALEHALRCGEYLLKARRALCRLHGQWLPWLKERKVAQQRASEYMRLATSKAEGKLPDVGTLTEALRWLAGGADGLSSPPAPKLAAVEVTPADDGSPPQPKLAYVEFGPDPPPKPPMVAYVEERPDRTPPREQKVARRRQRFFHLPKHLRKILGSHEVTRRERTMLALGRLGDTALGRQVARMLAGGEHKAVRKAVLDLAAEAARLREASAAGPAADAGDHGDHDAGTA